MLQRYDLCNSISLSQRFLQIPNFAHSLALFQVDMLDNSDQVASKPTTLKEQTVKSIVAACLEMAQQQSSNEQEATLLSSKFWQEQVCKYTKQVVRLLCATHATVVLPLLESSLLNVIHVATCLYADVSVHDAFSLSNLLLFIVTSHQGSKGSKALIKKDDLLQTLERTVWHWIVTESGEFNKAMMGADELLNKLQDAGKIDTLGNAWPLVAVLILLCPQRIGKLFNHKHDFETVCLQIFCSPKKYTEVDKGVKTHKQLACKLVVCCANSTYFV